jgi:hypothetical protein
MEPQEKEVEKKPQETAEVDAEVAEEAQVEEQKLVNITMVDLNNRKINLKVNISTILISNFIMKYRWFNMNLF